jgi:hypothetical protein
MGNRGWRRWDQRRCRNDGRLPVFDIGVVAVGGENFFLVFRFPGFSRREARPEERSAPWGVTGPLEAVTVKVPPPLRRTTFSTKPSVSVALSGRQRTIVPATGDAVLLSPNLVVAIPQAIAPP